MRLSVTLADTCNLKCDMCSFRPRMTGKTMSLDKFREILKQAKSTSPMGRTIEYIRLDGNKEVLGYKELETAVVETKKAGFSPQIISNGVLLTKEKSKMLLDSGLDFLRVSVTGLTPEVYQKFQGSGQTLEKAGAQLNQTVENIRYFAEIKKKYGRPVIMGLTYVLSKETAPNARKDLDFWLGAGVDFVSFTGFFEDMDPALFDQTPHEKYIGCVTRPTVAVNGDLYRCCASYGEEDYVLGNVFEQSIDEIYRSDKTMRLMRALNKFDGKILPNGCKKCPFIVPKDRIIL